MKYEQIRNLLDEPFRRLTGVKRQTFEKMVKILRGDDKNKKIKGGCKNKGSRTDNTNSIDSGQNGSTKKLIRKGRAQAEARDCSFERSLFNTFLQFKNRQGIYNHMKFTTQLIYFFLLIFSGLNAEEPLLHLSFEFLNSLDLSPSEKDIKGLHQLLSYHGRKVEIRGFLYHTETEGWVLSSEPDLKSCCIGSVSKVVKQIFLEGDLIPQKINSIATIQGLFIVEPIRDEKGNLKRLFKIVEPKIVRSSHKLSHAALIGGLFILFLICILTIVRLDLKRNFKK